MAKRNNSKKNLSLSPGDQEVVFGLAYDLYLAPPETQASKAAKKLLALRRKELPAETLSAGSVPLSRYRLLMMEKSADFESLCLVLLKAAGDSVIKESVESILLDHLCRDMMRSLDFVYEMVDEDDWGRGPLRSTEDMAAFASKGGERTHLFFDQLVPCWACISDYFDLLDTWSELDAANLQPSMDVRADMLKELAVDLKDVSQRLKITDDVSLINAYSNSLPFYEEVMTDAVQMFKDFSSPAQVMAIKHRNFDYSFDLLRKANSSFADAADEIMGKNNKYLAVLSELPDEEVVRSLSPEQMEWMTPVRMWLSFHAHLIRSEILLSGIDLFILAIKSPLSAREARAIVKKAFLYYESCQHSLYGDDSICDYSNNEEKEAVVEMAVRMWADALISKRADYALKQAASSKDTVGRKDLSKAVALTEKLRKENARLRQKTEEKNAGDDPALKEKNALIKDLRRQLHEAEALLSKEKERAGFLEEEIRDLRALAELEMDEEADVSGADEEVGVTEEFFREYIKEHRVLVWGLRDSTEQKYAALYPELNFVDSNRRLTRRQLEAYDVFIMCTSNTNHANYWASRDTAKASGIKMVYLAKTMNDPKWLRWALGKVLGMNDD